MTKAEAIFSLIQEGRSEREATTTAAQRVVRACKVLGLERAATIEVLSFLDFCDMQGTPYRNLDMDKVLGGHSRRSNPNDSMDS